MSLLSSFGSRIVPKAFSNYLRASISRKVIVWLGLPITGLSCSAVAIGYHYAIDRLTLEKQHQIQLYLRERSQRESIVFQLARKQHLHLKGVILEQLPKIRKVSPDPAFAKLLLPWSDGTRRNFPQNRPITEFDRQHQSSIFIGKNVSLSRSLKQDILLFHTLGSTYGPSWTTQVSNLWINSSANVSTNYWPSLPWALQAPASTDINQEEYGKIAQKAYNPDRSSRWTNLYFDQAAQHWMVSLVTPVDDSAGNHIASIGNDIILSDLLTRTQNSELPGAQSILISHQGDLLVDASRQAAITAAGGRLSIDQIRDPNLSAVWKEALAHHTADTTTQRPFSTTPRPKFSRDEKFLIAIEPLIGTDWYFALFYSRTMIEQRAWLSILPIVIMSGLLILMELLLIWVVLARQINRPLLQLVQATETLSSDPFLAGKWDRQQLEDQLNHQLVSHRQDEVGSLFQSFYSMSQALQQSLAQLNQQNDSLESQVQERTQALRQAIEDLKMTQAQLIQSEKMSSLGQMVAGVAHEINNPVSFIHGNLQPARRYIQDFIDHLSLYQNAAPADQIAQHAEDIDLDFLLKDFSQLLNSMQVGTDRIRDIVLGLRNFSRLDEADAKLVNLHEGLESTLLVLNHRALSTTCKVQIDKQYGHLPPIDCFPSQLNQVFLHLLTNAFDALEQFKATHPVDWIPTLTIDTQLDTSDPHFPIARIQIGDNGPGIPIEIQSQIFDPFFTTKAIGQGTGLGLAISHQIIVEKHGGQLTVESRPGQGSTFTIDLPYSPLMLHAPHARLTKPVLN